MSDLIDRNQLDDVCSRLNADGWGITRNEYKLIDRVLFEFPSAEKTGKWIPCEEKLPEGIRFVLVTIKDPEYGSSYIDVMHTCSPYFRCWRDGTVKDKSAAVIAWMELPVPYVRFNDAL